MSTGPCLYFHPAPGASFTRFSNRDGPDAEPVSPRSERTAAIISIRLEPGRPSPSLLPIALCLAVGIP